MARTCRTCLIAATVLASTAGACLAQIVVPDVNAGAKSSVPSLNTFGAPPSKFRPAQVQVPTEGLTPTTPDPRCRQLTPDQRRLTPGCQ